MSEHGWGSAGLGLLLLGAGLLWWGFSVEATGAVVAGIVVVVFGLACLRARSWIRKTRALTEVGLDLHVPDDS